MKESSDAATAGWRTQESCLVGQEKAEQVSSGGMIQHRRNLQRGGGGGKHRGRRGVALTRDRNASSPATGGRQSHGCKCWEMGERSTASLRKS